MRIFVLSSHKPVPAAPAASSTAIPAAAMPRRNAPVVMFVLPLLLSVGSIGGNIVEPKGRHGMKSPISHPVITLHFMQHGKINPSSLLSVKAGLSRPEADHTDPVQLL
jgi:hypothetical protein